MRRTIQEITKLLNPPGEPGGLDRSWAEVEREIGLHLPDDYKQFIDLYGTGTLSSAEGWLNVWNFRDASLFTPPLLDCVNGSSSVAGYYRHRVNTSGYPCPYPIYPDPGGLFWFATCVDVHYLNWLTIGPPNRWNIVYYFSDGIEFTHLVDESFGSCLLKMLRQEYTKLEHPSALAPPFEFTELRG